jgi:hypothetical protein
VGGAIILAGLAVIVYARHEAAAHEPHCLLKQQTEEK